MIPIRFALIATAVSTCMLAACATSTVNYTPPVSVAVSNSKVTPAAFEPTWDKLVRELSSDFFVINNIDKASRLINISFSSNHPSEFVDCGRSVRTFKNARGERRYDYAAADSSEFTAANKQGTAFNYRRTTKLDGRTNIYVAPEGTGTVVTVNSKYVLNVQFRAFNLDGGPAGNESFSWDFSTKQPFSDGEVRCYATGAIERRILQLVE